MSNNLQAPTMSQELVLHLKGIHDISQIMFHEQGDMHIVIIEQEHQIEQLKEEKEEISSMLEDTAATSSRLSDALQDMARKADLNAKLAMRLSKELLQKSGENDQLVTMLKRFESMEKPPTAATCTTVHHQIRAELMSDVTAAEELISEIKAVEIRDQEGTWPYHPVGEEVVAPIVHCRLDDVLTDYEVPAAHLTAADMEYLTYIADHSLALDEAEAVRFLKEADEFDSEPACTWSPPMDMPDSGQDDRRKLELITDAESDTSYSSSEPSESSSDDGPAAPRRAVSWGGIVEGAAARAAQLAVRQMV